MGRAVCLLAVMIANVAVLSDAGPVFTIPLGTMLVLVLPGYAWLGAVRHHEPQSLANGALVVMASTGLAIVLGLELNLLPSGLTRIAWVAGLSAVTAAGLATSWIRGRSLPRPDRPFPMLRGPSAATGLRISIVIVLVGATGGISVASQNAWIERQRFSELALTHSGAVPGVYIRNLEGRQITYTVSTWVGQRQVTRFRVRLGSGRHFARPLNARLVPRDSEATLKVTLDRPGAPSPYRTVLLRQSKHA